MACGCAVLIGLHCDRRQYASFGPLELRELHFLRVQGLENEVTRPSQLLMPCTTYADKKRSKHVTQ